MTDRPETPPLTPLMHGEVHITTWKPRFLSFAQRALLLAALTSAGIGLFPIRNLTVLSETFSIGTFPATLLFYILVFPTILLFYIFLFDDHTNWFRHRQDQWQLTNLRLIYENPNEPDINGGVSLGDIEKLKPWFWWSLRIVLKDRRVMVMKFIPQPRNIRAQIYAAQQALGSDLHEGPHG